MVLTCFKNEQKSNSKKNSERENENKSGNDKDQDGNSGLGKTSHIRKEEHREKDVDGEVWLLDNPHKVEMPKEEQYKFMCLDRATGWYLLHKSYLKASKDDPGTADGGNPSPMGW
jgi:hypothetical protein